MDLNKLDQLCIKAFDLPSNYSCTRDIAQAWQVLEKVSGNNPCVAVRRYNGKWMTFLRELEYVEHGWDTPELSIVIAALKAKGIEINDEKT